MYILRNVYIPNKNYKALTRTIRPSLLFLEDDITYRFICTNKEGVDLVITFVVVKT